MKKTESADILKFEIAVPAFFGLFTNSAMLVTPYRKLSLCLNTLATEFNKKIFKMSI